MSPPDVDAATDDRAEARPARPSPTFQVAVDCTDPHRLGRFWAEVMHYDFEENHDQVLAMIEQGYATRDQAIEIDGRLFWGTAAALNDPSGERPRLLFQAVPEPKTSKNRVHLDLRVPEGTRDAEVARIVALGATRLWEGSQGPHSWITLADPEGNEFCVS